MTSAVNLIQMPVVCLSRSNGNNSRSLKKIRKRNYIDTYLLHWTVQYMRVYDKESRMENPIPTPHMLLWECSTVLFGGDFSTLYGCLCVHINQWLTAPVECQAPTWQEKPLYFWLLVQNQISFPPMCSGSFQAFMENILCFCRQMPPVWQSCRNLQIIWIMVSFWIYTYFKILNVNYWILVERRIYTT